MNLPESQPDSDNTSLEGLEGLLDQIFEGPALPSEAPSPMVAQEEVLTEPSVLDHISRVASDLPRAAARLHRMHHRPRKMDEKEILGTRLKLYSARLQFALEELEKTRFSEQQLRINLADAADRIRSLEEALSEKDEQENQPAVI